MLETVLTLAIICADVGCDGETYLSCSCRNPTQLKIRTASSSSIRRRWSIRLVVHWILIPPMRLRLRAVKSLPSFELSTWRVVCGVNRAARASSSEPVSQRRGVDPDRPVGLSLISTSTMVNRLAHRSIARSTLYPCEPESRLVRSRYASSLVVLGHRIFCAIEKRSLSFSKMGSHPPSNKSRLMRRDR